jgi:hypothetical protein
MVSVVSALRVCQEISVTTCLVLLPPSFVTHLLQISEDMRLVRASLVGKIPAASCDTYFLTDP